MATVGFIAPSLYGAVRGIAVKLDAAAAITMALFAAGYLRGAAAILRRGPRLGVGTHSRVEATGQ
jgi:hypothetical protein